MMLKICSWQTICRREGDGYIVHEVDDNDMFTLVNFLDQQRLLNVTDNLDMRLQCACMKVIWVS